MAPPPFEDGSLASSDMLSPEKHPQRNPSLASMRRGTPHALRNRRSSPKAAPMMLSANERSSSFEENEGEEERSARKDSIYSTNDTKINPVISSSEQERRVVFSLPPSRSRYPFFLSNTTSGIHEQQQHTTRERQSTASRSSIGLDESSKPTDSPGLSTRNERSSRSSSFSGYDCRNILAPASTLPSVLQPGGGNGHMSTKTDNLYPPSEGSTSPLNKPPQRDDSIPSLPAAYSSSSSLRPPQDNNLHKLCRLAGNLNDLKRIQQNNVLHVEAAAQSNFEGQTALHVLSENSQVANCFSNCPDDRPGMLNFLLKIWKTYPAAMITTDLLQQRVPFEAVLKDWAASCTASTSLGQQQLQQSNKSQRTETGSYWFSRPADTQSTTSTNSTMSACGQLTAEAFFAMEALSSLLDYLEDKLQESFDENNNSTGTSGDQAQQVGGKQKAASTVAQYLQDVTVHDIRSELVQSMASIPNIVAAILLLPTERERSYCLSTTLVQRILVSKYSVGDWLTHMLVLQADRAMEYLQLVSEILPNGDDNSSKNNDCNRLQEDQLVYEISRLPDFCPSLLSIGDARKVEEAATTRLVRQVLDRTIARPFAVALIFFDAVFLALLLCGYRGAISQLFTAGGTDYVLPYIYMANMGIFYFLLREVGKVVSLCCSSVYHRNMAVAMSSSHNTTTYRVVYQQWLWSFWNWSDFLSIVLALVSTIHIRSHLNDWPNYDDNNESALRSLLAITTGFLWLRVLSFLKGINMQLATFVLAILQITRDIFWFCVILLTLVVSFAQMFYTLLVPKSCTADSANRECTQSEYYLKVYAILLGDFGLFERDQFTSFMSVFLAVFYTFMVVLVLLNILIAVASDSYEKCLLRSQNLFGRARVMMVAELVCFQNLLLRRIPSNGSAANQRWSWTRGWDHGSLLFFSLSSVVVLVWMIGETVSYVRGHGHFWMSFVSIFINVSLFIGISVSLSRNIDDQVKDRGDDTKEGCSRWGSRSERFGRFVQKRILRLLGTSGGNGSASDTGVDEVWRGRMHHLQKELTCVSEETQARNEEHFRKLEGQMKQALSSFRHELAELRQRELYNGSTIRTSSCREESWEHIETEDIRGIARNLETVVRRLERLDARKG